MRTLHIETKHSDPDKADEKDTAEDGRCYVVGVHVSFNV